jgi:hypothetical protein
MYNIYTTFGSDGSPLYLSMGTSGTATNVQPSTSGNVVRIVGYTYKGNPGVVRFWPDNTWVVV